MRWLFVIRHAPYEGGRAQETLDLLLTLAAFDQTVEVLLLDDGVWQLHRSQQPAVLRQKSLAAMWQALEIYGIDLPWVESEALAERRLEMSELALPVKPIRRAEIAGLLRRYDRVLGD